MEQDKYFKIEEGEDGEVNVISFDREDLLKELEERHEDGEEFHFKSFIKPSHFDPLAWEENILIIKGDIVIPEARKTVTKFYID